jgi:hypothetical protein
MNRDQPTRLGTFVRCPHCERVLCNPDWKARP